MNKKMILISALVAASLLSGCVGTGPNTQQGAVTGGALGALAGAIIGNNSGGGNSLGGAAIGAAVGALAGGTMGNSVDNQRGSVYGESTEPRARYYSSAQPPQPPPAPVVVETFSPPPAPNALWIPGYWSYDGYRYTWTSAHWEIPPQNARAYVTAHWEGRRGGYVFVPSYWR